VNIIHRKDENLPVSLNINSTVQKLSILIENQGRINLGNYIEDRKVSRLQSGLLIFH